MHADVGDGASASEGAIRKPLALMGAGGKGEFRTRKNKAAKITGLHASTDARRALMKAKHLGYSQKKPQAMSCVDHFPAFIGVHAHGLFAEYRLATSQSREHIETMAGVRRG